MRTRRKYGCRQEFSGVTVSLLLCPAEFSSKATIALTLAALAVYCYSHPISDYIPYVELLPAEITVPLLFNKEEIQILRGTPLYEDTIERRRRCWAAFIAALPLIHEEAQKCSGVPSKVVQLLDQAAGETRRVGASGVPGFSDLTWAPALFRQWLWAQAIYNSRSFPPSLLLAPQNEVGLLGPVLLPGIDILNHARNKAVTWSYPCAQTTTPESAAHVTVWDYFNDSREPHVAVTLRYTAEAGTQAFNCYGAKSNEEFLAGYGFVVPGGPDDTLTLVLGGSHSASVPQPQDFKSASGSGSELTLRRPWGQRHYWKRLQAEDSGSGRAPTSLLLELRERLLESESIPSTTTPSLHESWLLRASLATPSTDSTPIEVPLSKTSTIGPSEIGDSLSRSHEKHQRYVQALHLDGEILETLEQLLCAKRRAFKKAQRELNVAENVRADVEAIVAEYRKGQEVLFAEAINWTRSTMEELIDVIDRTSEQQDY